LAPREVFFDLFDDVLRGALAEHRVRFAEAVRHLAQDRERSALRFLELLAELVARELEEHRVDRRPHARGARLVVEERELAEIFARAHVLQDDGWRVFVGRRKEDLHRALEHDVHRRALVSLAENHLLGLVTLLREALREDVTIVVGQTFEQRDLSE